ncbi:hypothetical protein JEP40_15495 [Proteus vulgaris]|uniref:hypothetical protein n=1 Tax=Proteus vulgaris TaxID=585 RepID=UPI0018E46B81|nr:hypothetical protein [Proteus vulgaris]MBI6530514.1 hypothetical protein [Proteus vulgaris]
MEFIKTRSLNEDKKYPLQEESYSEEELNQLRNFILTVKNDTSRSQLVCWGNHSDYTHGY